MTNVRTEGEVESETFEAAVKVEVGLSVMARRTRSVERRRSELISRRSRRDVSLIRRCISDLGDVMTCVHAGWTELHGTYNRSSERVLARQRRDNETDCRPYDTETL